MVDFFKAPIPGQSLTAEPKNSPWENPPELNTVEEATQYYIKKLSNEDALDDLALLFQLGGTLDEITETMTVMGTMKGIHTVDVQMLVKPVVGSFIKAAMTTYGVEVKDTLISPEERMAEKENKRLDTIMKAAIEESLRENGKGDAGTELLQDMQEAVDETPVEEDTTEEPEMDMPVAEEEAPKGLMARG